MPCIDTIFTSCRKGDLTRIRYLVEKKEVDLNVRDCWDSTPLYYACHCGHKEVVEYLLSNGARCEANTFDGERCLYGALTNDIKKLLLDSKLLSTNKKRDDYDEFCERMMKAEEFSDVSLYIGTREFKLHRCILSSRSEYFKENLQSKWKLAEIRTNGLNTEVFNEFIHFLYTGRLQMDKKLFKEICALADTCKVRNLTRLVRETDAEARFLEGSKNRVTVSTLVVDSQETREDLVKDFEIAMVPRIPEKFSCKGALFGGLNPGYYDVCLKVDTRLFYCNKLFLCCRSEFFNAFVRDHFAENGQTANNIKVPVITLKNIKPSVLTCVLHYIYTNSAVSISFSQEEILDVLEAAEMYLLPGLKKHCGNFLCDLLSHENIVELLKISRMYDLPKLDNSCAKFIAEHIEAIVQDSEFKAFVVSDAQKISDREETDTISIIDDIRFHITSRVASFSDLTEFQPKLKIIDDLLEELGLGA